MDLNFKHRKLYIYTLRQDACHTSDGKPLFVYLWRPDLARTVHVGGTPACRVLGKTLGNRSTNIISLASPNGPPTSTYAPAWLRYMQGSCYQ